MPRIEIEFNFDDLYELLEVLANEKMVKLEKLKEMNQNGEFLFEIAYIEDQVQKLILIKRILSILQDLIENSETDEGNEQNV